jgi:hypothetical protein
VSARERLTPERRAYSIDRLEAALGLTGQPRVVMEHEKPSRASPAMSNRPRPCGVISRLVTFRHIIQ